MKKIVHIILQLTERTLDWFIQHELAFCAFRFLPRPKHQWQPDWRYFKYSWRISLNREVQDETIISTIIFFYVGLGDDEGIFFCVLFRIANISVNLSFFLFFLLRKWYCWRGQTKDELSNIRTVKKKTHRETQTVPHLTQ